jgi:hypothetical protein
MSALRPRRLRLYLSAIRHPRRAAQLRRWNKVAKGARYVSHTG